MKSLISILLSATILSGCASYSPIQYVGGKRHRDLAQVEMCSYYIFTFPTSPDNMTVAKVIRENRIDENQIYSIETTGWPYLGYLFGQRCLLINMNDNYSAPVLPPVEKISAPIVTPPVAVIAAPVATAPVNKSPKSEVLPEFSISGNRRLDFATCDRETSLAKYNCRKQMDDHYKKIEQKK